MLKILDEYTLVVSLGANDVSKGDRLVVYSLGAEIKDEDRSLGRLEIVKGRIVVDYVQEKFSTAVSPLMEYVTQPYFQTSSTIFGGTETRRDPLPLAEAPSDVAFDRKIRVGDLVKKEG